MFGKSRRAKAVLEKMISMYEAGTSQARPNVFTYTAVINACAFAIGEDAEKKKALKIASATLDELCRSDYGAPNHVTFVAYLSAIRNLVPEDDETRVALLTTVFSQCCKDGQVDELTLRRLESALTAKQAEEVYQSVGFNGTSPLDIGVVPTEWRRNVVEKKTRKGKSAKIKC